MLEARQELRPLLLKSHDRLKDLLFLDLALDSTVRTAIERGYEQLNDAGPEVSGFIHRHDKLFSNIMCQFFFSSRYFFDILFVLCNAFMLQKIMYFISLVLENLALSSDDNEDLVYCLKVNIQ